eukprot:COSAG01_NODE_2885_length_6901_cov_101.837028_8_plen_825_part_00
MVYAPVLQLLLLTVRSSVAAAAALSSSSSSAAAAPMSAQTTIGSSSSSSSSTNSTLAVGGGDGDSAAYSVKVFVNQAMMPDCTGTGGDQVASVPISSGCSQLFPLIGNAGLYVKLSTIATPTQAGRSPLYTNIAASVYGPLVTDCSGTPIFGGGSDTSIVCFQCLTGTIEGIGFAMQFTCPLFDAWGMCPRFLTFLPPILRHGIVCEGITAVFSLTVLHIISCCMSKPCCYMFRGLSCLGTALFAFVCIQWGSSFGVEFSPWFYVAIALQFLGAIYEFRRYCKYARPELRAIRQPLSSNSPNRLDIQRGGSSSTPDSGQESLCAALFLDDTCKDDAFYFDRSSLFGLYMKKQMPVNGRPAFQNMDSPSFWIAFDGTDWMLQTENTLGQGRGKAQYDGARMPGLFGQQWKFSQGGNWVVRRSIFCKMCTPMQVAALGRAEADLAQKALFLETGDDRCDQPEKLYRLLGGWGIEVFRPTNHTVNDRPTWIARASRFPFSVYESFLTEAGKQNFMSAVRQHIPAPTQISPLSMRQVYETADLGKHFRSLNRSMEEMSSMVFKLSFRDGDWALTVDHHSKTVAQFLIPGPFLLDYGVFPWVRPIWRTRDDKFPTLRLRVASQDELAQDNAVLEELDTQRRQATAAPATEATEHRAGAETSVVHAVAVAEPAEILQVATASEPAVASAPVAQAPPPPSNPEIVGALDMSQEVASAAQAAQVASAPQVAEVASAPQVVPPVRPETELLELLAAAEASCAQTRAYAKAAKLANHTTLLQDLAGQIEGKQREEEQAAAQRQYQIAASHHTALQALEQQMSRAVEEARRLLQA